MLKTKVIIVLLLMCFIQKSLEKQESFVAIFVGCVKAAALESYWKQEVWKFNSKKNIVWNLRLKLN